MISSPNTADTMDARVEAGLTAFRDRVLEDMRLPEERMRDAIAASDAVAQAPQQPTWIAHCCECGRIVDTREQKDGGDPFGCELSDGRWTCSADCWDTAVGEAPQQPVAPEDEITEQKCHSCGDYNWDQHRCRSGSFHDWRPTGRKLHVHIAKPLYTAPPREEDVQRLVARVAELERQIAFIGTDDQWRRREAETQEALQAIGEEFGIRGGEPRVDGLRRVLTEYRAHAANKEE